jgi:hypothetical protein
MRAIARVLLPVVLAMAVGSPVQAEEIPAPAWWEDGCWSTEFMTGYYPKSSLGPPARGFLTPDVPYSRIDYVPLSPRLGYELPKVWLPNTCLEGRVEGLLEYDYFVIVRQFGSYFTGPSALLRYNFLQPEASLLKLYIQGGAGIVLTDAYRTPVQRLIGRWQEFLLQTEVGLRYDLTEQLSFQVEGGLQHISNARLATRNGGLNSIGFTVGFRYTLGKP